jgi:hypothetical protein
MNELNNAHELDPQVDNIVARWLAARDASDVEEWTVARDVLLPAVEEHGLLGIAILERLGHSEDPEVRLGSAVYMAFLPPDTPKERYLALARHLLEDRNNRVFHTMWLSLRDNENIQLAWHDVRLIIDDAARGDLLTMRPEDGELPPYAPPPSA